MKNDYIQDFVNAAMMNNTNEARKALDLGLNKQEGFNFSNPRVFFSILNTRSQEVVLLAVEYGFEPNELFNLAQQQNSQIVIDTLHSVVLVTKLNEQLQDKEKDKKKIKM